MSSTPASLITPAASPPDFPSSNVYPSPPPGLEHVSFDLTWSLHEGAVAGTNPKVALEKTLKYLQTQQSKFMGYQANQTLHYADELRGFMNIHVNNIGDPFLEGNFTVSSKFMERAVLDYYASLWNAKWPHNPNTVSSVPPDNDGESFWGYLLTMGSTEGNMYALWNARDYLSGKVLQLERTRDGQPRLVYCQAPIHPEVFARTSAENCANYFSPVAFYSEDTHYSFAKATRLVGLPIFSEIGNEKYPDQCPITDDGKWPSEVPSVDGAGGPGDIDVNKLVTLVTFFAEKCHPIFVSLNYGSTFKGNYDDVSSVIHKLTPVFKKYGQWQRRIPTDAEDLYRTGFWIHVDGALGAAYMPYLKMAEDKGLKYKDGSPVKSGPAFDFTLDSVHSIVTSGHKWMGHINPSGVYISKRKYQMKPPSDPEYIGTPDTTFAGSRNGLSVIVLWTYLSKRTLKQEIEKAVSCQEMAMYILKEMQQIAKKLPSIKLWVDKAPVGLTVRFRQLNADLVHKYSLSNETLYVGGEKRQYSHVFAMEHVTKELADSLLGEIKSLGLDAFVKDDPASKAAIARLPLSSDSAVPSVHNVPFHGRGFF